MGAAQPGWRRGLLAAATGHQARPRRSPWLGWCGEQLELVIAKARLLEAALARKTDMPLVGGSSRAPIYPAHRADNEPVASRWDQHEPLGGPAHFGEEARLDERHDLGRSGLGAAVMGPVTER
jgi:hypothetical protein